MRCDICTLLETDFNGKTVDQVVETLSSISPKITELILNSRKLYEYTTDEIVQIFSAVPSTVSELSLGLNALFEKSASDIAKILSAIPPTVVNFSLHAGELKRYSGIELQQIFSALSGSLKVLNLSWSELHRVPTDILVQGFGAISSPLTKLSLRYCILGDKPGADLVRILSAFPSTLRELDLASNGLYERTGDEIRAILSTLPPGLRKLDLSRNGFRRGAKILCVLSALPKSVDTLLFNGGFYKNKKAEDIKQAFLALSNSSVSTLELRENDFFKKSVTEIMDIFTALPPSVSRLDLSENGRFSGTDEELEELFDLFTKKGIRCKFSSRSHGIIQAKYLKYLQGKPLALCQVIHRAAQKYCQTPVVDNKESIEHSFVKFFEKNPGLVKVAGGRIASYFLGTLAPVTALRFATAIDTQAADVSFLTSTPELTHEVCEPDVLTNIQLVESDGALTTTDDGLPSVEIPNEVQKSKSVPASRCSVFSTTSAKVSAAVGCGTVFTGFIAALVTASIVTSSTGIGLPIGIACAVAAAVLALWLGVTAGVERCYKASP